jgi:hypothetical protein
MRFSHIQQALLRWGGNRLPNHDLLSLSRKGDMETATVRLLPAGCIHFQPAKPIAGEGRRDPRHAGTGGCPDERHDSDVIGGYSHG